MRWTDSPYYCPEKCGLEIVAQIDFSSGSYEFDYRVVWRNLEDGVLYTARDSGCSCPSPFENYNELASLEKVNIKALEQELAGGGGYEYASYDDRSKFMDAVKAAVKAQQQANAPIHGKAALSRDIDL